MLRASSFSVTTTGAYAQLSQPSSSQQNMTSLNATNATAVVATNNTTTAATAPTPTRIITQLIGVRGEAIPLHAENIQFQQEDPLFAKLVQIINDCMNFVVAQNQEGHIEEREKGDDYNEIEITRMTMMIACCFSSVLVLLTAETTFFSDDEEEIDECIFKNPH